MPQQTGPSGDDVLEVLEVSEAIRPAGSPEPDPFTGGNDAGLKPQLPKNRPEKPIRET